MTGSDFSNRGRVFAAALLTGLALCASSPLSAQIPARGDAAPAPRQSTTFQFALANGMQVVVIPDHRAPVATQMLWFRVGGVDDPPGLSGIAHFFEHMMFRGTKAVPGDGFAQTVSRNGGESNAFTSHDYTAYYEQIAKDRLPLAMRLEADRLMNLTLTEATVGPERDVVLEERRMRVENDPQSLMNEQMMAALYLSHPYGRPVIGWAEEIRRIDRVNAQDFYRRHYAPNNAILVVAGDVTPEEVRKLATEHYGKLPRRPLEPRSESAEPPRLAETRMTVRRADARVPVFSRFYRVPSYTQGRPGQAEGLEMYAELLGGGATSLLYRTLVEEKKLASEAGADYDGFNRDAGNFVVYAVPRPGVTLEALEKAVDQVMAGAVRAAPQAQDLTRAKTRLVASTIYRRDSQFALANTYGQALAIGLTANDVDTWPSRMRAVTGEQVRQAAAGLSRRNAVTGYLLPSGGKK